MDEATWLACTDPEHLAVFCENCRNERKMRLFLCACCHRLWHILTREEVRQAIAIAEQYADGLVDQNHVRTARQTIYKARAMAPLNSRWEKALSLAAAATRDNVCWEGVGNVLSSLLEEAKVQADVVGESLVPRCEQGKAIVERENRWLCSVIRDLWTPFGWPQIRADWLRWNDGSIPKMAQTIYDERAFDQLPILADALEDAGCTDPAILNHCRQPGTHVLGCWLLDVLRSVG
jgi:hypothetical protein